MEWKESDNYSERGPRSRVKFVAVWFALSRGTFGLSLKPKLMKVRFQPEENHFDTCLLDSDVDSDEETEQPSALPCALANLELCFDKNAESITVGRSC